MDTTTGLSEHRNPQSSCYLKSFNLKMLTPYLLHLSLSEQSRQQLLRIDRKDYFELPTVKIFLNKVKKGDDDLYYFQDVIIKDLENVKDS